MTSYLGRHAELYDLFYEHKPYADEAAFVDRQLRSYGAGPPSRLLELACGTGRHAVALEQHGYDVVGVDYSEAMVRRAQQRALELRVRADFRCADMRTLDLEDTSFDAAICLFDSLGYVQTNAAVLETLQAVRRHVREGGVFLIEYWHAAAMLRDFDPLRIRRWSVPDGEVLRISETDLDCAQQLSHVRYTVYEHGHDGRYTSFTETQTNRYFLVQEMRSLLEQAGWTPREEFAGFQEAASVDESTWHVVVVAQNGLTPPRAA